ncbi:DNA-directed RNA polymerase III subunit RPC8 isoform X3 [Ambystoma mexicanum]
MWVFASAYTTSHGWRTLTSSLGMEHLTPKFTSAMWSSILSWTKYLLGRLRAAAKRESTVVSLGFFDDIIIPPESLQQPGKFDEGEQVWVWEYETDEGAHDLYMDIGEEIRFRVVDETFLDTSPTGPSAADASTSTTEEVIKKDAPYTLVGSISEPGLGLLSWWTSN